MSRNTIAFAAMVSVASLALWGNPSAADAAAVVTKKAPAARAHSVAPPDDAPEKFPRIRHGKFPPAGTGPRSDARAGAAPGWDGDSEPAARGRNQYESRAFGTALLPYTTARVTVGSFRADKLDELWEVPVTMYPFRAAGKLRMRFGASWFSCSASLIGRGILVTAAHCVHDFGQGAAGWADEVRFIPSQTREPDGSPTQPYGTYLWSSATIPAAYFNGTDTCDPSAVGIVCNNDIAIVVLQPKSGKHAGERLGWYSYGWNGYSYVASPVLGNKTVAHLTELGYPGAFDAGIVMQRNESVGYYYTLGNLKNTRMGTAQTGGSSGGAWLVNFGMQPVVGGGHDLGQHTVPNVVVGVTSWGWTNTAVNEQGASFFGQNVEFPNADYGGHGAGNIGALVNAVCGAGQPYC